MLLSVQVAAMVAVAGAGELPDDVGRGRRPWRVLIVVLTAAEAEKAAEAGMLGADDDRRR